MDNLDCFTSEPKSLQEVYSKNLFFSSLAQPSLLFTSWYFFFFHPLFHLLFFYQRSFLSHFSLPFPSSSVFSPLFVFSAAQTVLLLRGSWWSKAPGCQRLLVVWVPRVLVPLSWLVIHLCLCWSPLASWWFSALIQGSSVILLVVLLHFPSVSSSQEFPAGVWLGCVYLFSVCRLITLVCI